MEIWKKGSSLEAGSDKKLMKISNFFNFECFLKIPFACENMKVYKRVYKFLLNFNVFSGNLTPPGTPGTPGTPGRTPGTPGTNFSIFC